MSWIKYVYIVWWLNDTWCHRNWIKSRSLVLFNFYCKGRRGSQTKYFLKNKRMHHLKEGDRVSLFSLQVYLNPSLQITDITASDTYISTYMDSEHINFEFTGTVFSVVSPMKYLQYYTIILQITVAYVERWDFFLHFVYCPVTSLHGYPPVSFCHKCNVLIIISERYVIIAKARW